MAVGTKVLIVDDEPAVGELIRDLLEDSGLEMEVVSTPEAALPALKSFKPAIALVDYRLGAVTGLELAHEFRKVDPDLPVILMTAYPSLDLAVKAIQQEIYDFIVKPIDRSFLTRSVAKAIENRKLVEENKALMENLKRSSAMKTKFLSIVTHDLRSPLTSVRGYCEMLRSEKDLTDAEKETSLSHIEKSVLRMNEMVASLLDLVSIEAGKLSIDKKPLDYAAICGELEGMFAPVAKGKDVELSWEVAKVPLKVQGDSVRLHQVLSNLVSNALKHTPKGRRVKVAVSAEDGKILTEVTDTGEGIPKEDQERIFEQFYQAETSTHKREGLGLGLAIAKDIVTAHGGGIGCRSPGSGQGSTFYFTLPISV